ncbi:hypothetical protein [Absidia glauca]|uniref:Uncharacterized protein n=1 Tax=Absidia glauca TaxID=4829 RepID=A0A163MA55_ABSGL|nr:hypothetical protein [Absidia glauca]
MSTKRSLSLQIEEFVHRQSSTKPLKSAPRPTKHQMRQWVAEDPDSLQAKLAVSPYAAILASPMRYCTFHRKKYPSHLLARFGLGLDPTTYKPTAYPTQDHDSGRGYYVKLNRKVLQQIQSKEYKRLFRGDVRYAKSMATHLEHVMIQDLIHQAQALPPLIPIDNETEHHQYQCILHMNASSLSETKAPVYDVSSPPWQPLHQTLPQSCAALGVPKSIDTVPLAIALHRFNQWVQSSI